MDLISCSIILPIHNEEANLHDLFQSIDAFIIEYPSVSFEVIAVNDGSIDSSTSILNSIQLKCPLHIVTHTCNKGYGAALRSGFHHSSMDWVFFMDSDLQFDIQSLKRFWPFIEHYDAIIGYRKQRADNVVRRLNAKVWSMWTGMLFNISVTDINCAFKLFRNDTLKALNLQSNSALINTEILVGLNKMKADILEIPVPHFPRAHGTQSGASLFVVTNAVRESLSFLFNR